MVILNSYAMLVYQRISIEEEIHILSPGSCEEEVLVSQTLGDMAPTSYFCVRMSEKPMIPSGKLTAIEHGHL